MTVAKLLSRVVRMCRLVLGGELQVVKCECADLFWAVSCRFLSANVPTCSGR